ncbi:TetR/AcrR family transcriptional regulator [Actinomycetospora soli]|uniref:TetR/AcrR family transcriptional regulator n=1 Tax=Actinomycetospora soli TaxID=2893887 RepID=UPI001E332B82|nr:TetR family transcriptional regulator [Actinomycetospora soli]MCD2189827.1 TetR/AcrR family transcriptional regulator [Actinomycetospora soli]
MSAAERTAARRTRLLDATRGLIAEQGSTGLSVDGVCTRAELTKRYFYESFSGLDALLVAVFDDATAALRTALRTALADAPPELEDRIRVVVRSVLTALAADRGWARLWAEAPAHATLRSRRHGVIDEFVAALSGELAADPASGQDPAVTLLTLVAGVTEVVDRRALHDLPIADEALVSHLAAVGIAACAPLRPRR